MKLSAALVLLSPSTASASSVLLQTFFGIHHRRTAETCLTETTDLFVDGTELNSAFEEVVDKIDDEGSVVGR